MTCERCKLYGKLQFTGLTAVMKIMFGEGPSSALTRNEMVGLVNLLGKLSDSLKWYFEWVEYENSFGYRLKCIFSEQSNIFLTAIMFVMVVFQLTRKDTDDNNTEDKEEKKDTASSKIKTD